MPSVPADGVRPFELRTPATYLAACSHSPYHRGLAEALDRYRDDLIRLGNPWELWVEKIAEAKGLFARLIGARPEEVAPQPSVSAALGTLLSAFEYRTRNEIVVSDLEFPTTNHVALGQRRYGARVVTVRHQNYRIAPGQYAAAVGPSTALVSAVHVSSLNGFRQEIRPLSEIAHRAGAPIYVDAYQSLGTVPLDVRADDIDFLAAGTLKYLLGLPGLAFLFARAERIPELRPTYIGWFSQKDPFGFGAQELQFADSADRFQSGTWAIPAVYGSIEGLKIILDVGVGPIARKIGELTRYAIERGEAAGLTTITPHDDDARGAIVAFTVSDPHGFETRLRSEGIITSSRGIGLRIAPHFYNTRADIDLAVDRIAALERARSSATRPAAA